MDILTTGAALTEVALAIVIGLVEALKRIAGESRFAPLFALLIGIAISFLVTPAFEIREAILQGIIYGLSASGLYSGAKAIRKPQPTDPTL